ncbi:MAG: hypothetical protein JSR77_13805 [Planctomycetes bacterium]|nr:hypothetical protein [Planctomycetota bacterium]
MTRRQQTSLRLLPAVLLLAAGAAASAQVIVDNAGSARNGKVGYWSSIVARGGDVGISYYCEDDHAGSPPEMYTLRFAWRTGADWHWMTVDQGAGSHSTMRRGTDGLYQIAYDNWSGIGFAIGSAAGWTVSTVDTDPAVVPTHMSMALDSQQRPHIAYMNDANGGDYAIRYTHWNGSQWVRDAAELVIPHIWTPTIGFSNTWLQLDNADVPHIAFAQPSDTINAWGPIRYATLRNGVWTFENLGVNGEDPSLAIGTDNTPHMLFNSDAGITYAHKTAAGWQFETFVPMENGSGNALTLSDANQPFATFGLTANEDQYIARRDPSGWAVVRVDGDGDPGPHKILGRYGNGIDVDEHGVPHISYLNIDIYGPTHRCDLMYLGDTGGPAPCITITRAPQSLAICGSDGATFDALGQSDTPPTYAWEWRPATDPVWHSVIDGANLDPASGQPAFLALGAASPTLSLPPGGISMTAAAAFRCVLTCACGSAPTTPATLTINGAPTITTQPQDAQSCGGSPVQFSTLADGAPQYTWQWSPAGSGAWLDVTEGVNIDPTTWLNAFDATGSADPLLNLTPISLDPGASVGFRCFVSSACGEAMTNAAQLTTGGGTTITDQPDSLNICNGVPAMFDVATTSSDASYQWEMFNPNLSVWQNINDGANEHADLSHFTAAGATTANLTLEGFVDDDVNHTPKDGTMLVRCSISGSCGDTTSNTAELTVNICCPGDYNQDGGVDGADVESFFLDWEAGASASDLNQDGGIDGADVEAFFTRWEAGC